MFNDILENEYRNSKRDERVLKNFKEYFPDETKGRVIFDNWETDFRLECLMSGHYETGSLLNEIPLVSETTLNVSTSSINSWTNSHLTYRYLDIEKSVHYRPAVDFSDDTLENTTRNNWLDYELYTPKETKKELKKHLDQTKKIVWSWVYNYARNIGYKIYVNKNKEEYRICDGNGNGYHILILTKNNGDKNIYVGDMDNQYSKIFSRKSKVFSSTKNELTVGEFQSMLYAEIEKGMFELPFNKLEFDKYQENKKD